MNAPDGSDDLSGAVFCYAAQRFALLALGRAWILFGSRKNSKPEKCLKMPQNPQRPVHALLGTVGLEDSLAIKSALLDFTTTLPITNTVHSNT